MKAQYHVTHLRLAGGMTLAASLAAVAAVQDNWPQWRGPLQTGVSPSADPPTTWSETEHVKWKVKLPGDGSATPVVWENMVFVESAVPTGKKVEVKAGDAPAPGEGQTARRDPPGDQGSPRPPGGGGSDQGPRPGGPPGEDGQRPQRGVGPGGFGPGMFLGPQMLREGDKNKDEKLSREEFTGLADVWFDKLDTDKSGKLDRDQFTERFGNIMGPPPEGAPPGGGPARFIGPGMFAALDADKNGTLTRAEVQTTFTKWFTDWDTDKSGSLDAGKLRDGLNAVLPRPDFGGPGGPGGPGGRGQGRGGQKPAELYQFTVSCLDRETGKTLWEEVAREEVPHEGIRAGEGSFAASSGVTDGKHYFAYFGSRGLYCYDFKGKLEWSKDLGKMRVAMGFGEGSSPAIYKDTLVINWDNEDGSFITALDKNTGKPLWKETRDEGTSWATPLIIEKDGKTQVITAATRKIRSYDLATGKVLWECGGLTRNVIPSPVADDEKAYCMSGFMGNALLAIKLDSSGDLAGTDAIAWTRKKSTPYVPSPLLYGGKLYFYANNNAVLSCLNAKTGEPIFDAERVEGLQMVYASPVGAGGRVYLAGRNGATVVLKQSDKLEILATNKLDDRFDASPVAVGKELLLRGRAAMYCLADK